jgi:hypothetical protein
VEAFPVIARLKLYLASIAVGAAAAWQVMRLIHKKDAAEAKAKELQGYADTRRRMDKVDIDDSDNAASWLRERADKRNL